jgi:hypothetical protein
VTSKAGAPAPIRLILQIVDGEADPEELAELTAQLHRELAVLYPGELTAEFSAGTAAEVGDSGTRAIEPLLGLLAVTLANARLLPAVIKVIQTWLEGRQRGSVEIETGQGMIKVTGNPTKPQERMVKAFLEQVSGPVASGSDAIPGHAPSTGDAE